MDFSSKYIKMCEKAKEIQERFRGQYDYYIYIEWEYGKGIFLWGFCCGFKNIKKIVYLPCQDQLQEMIKNEYRDKETNIPFLHIYSCMLLDLYDLMNNNNYFYKFGDSMEQLWLAFVMYKKYRKVWNDKKEEWINENKNKKEANK